MDPQNPAPAAPDGTPPPTVPPAPDTVIAPTTPPEPEAAMPEPPAAEPPDVAPEPAETPVAQPTPVTTTPEAAQPTPGSAESAQPSVQTPTPSSAQPASAAKPEAKPANPKTHVPDTLPVTETDEHTVCVVRRHPIGIIGTYAMCGVIALITAVLALIVVPDLIGKGNGSSVLLAGTLVFAVVAAACAAFAFIAGKVYWGNSWTVTTDSLTQVRRLSLFNRQSSQLSLKDLEDVTAGQDGVIARIFNFGTLRVETAGESSKFIFPFCPNPNYYAQQILQARESFERNRTAEENTYQKTP